MGTTVKAVINCWIQAAFFLPVNTQKCIMSGLFTTSVSKLSQTCSRSHHCVALLADVREAQVFQVCHPMTSLCHVLKKSLYTFSLWSSDRKQFYHVITLNGLSSIHEPQANNESIVHPTKELIHPSCLYCWGKPSLPSSFLFLWVVSIHRSALLVQPFFRHLIYSTNIVVLGLLMEFLPFLHVS